MKAYDLQIGQGIRKLRISHHLTLQEIADKGAFSRSLLSKIETGKIMPSIETLAKIANALGTTVSALMEKNGTVDACTTKWGDVEANFSENELENRLSPVAVEIKEKKMQPFYFRLRKGEEAPRGRHSHIGEEFIFVFEGIIKFQVGHIEYTLGKGDSIYYKTVEKHLAIALSDVATAVIVLTS
jgi:transcriptional regulator with XRE-family HTH domain